MPSNLRLQTTFDAQSTQSYFPKTASTLPPAKKQRMSLTQTYRVASSARSKLGREAARPDHDLRLLVGHANLLDSLMVELADAEREQESWFNETLRKSSKPEAPKHIQWIDTIAEEQDEEESDSDSDSDYDDEEIFPAVPATSASRRATSPPPAFTLATLAEEDEDVEDYDFDDEHALTRTHSHPPELIHEDSEDSDDDSMPPSPPQSALEFDNKTRQAMEQNAFFRKAAEHHSQQPQVVSDDFMAAEMIPAQMVAAC